MPGWKKEAARVEYAEERRDMSCETTWEVVKLLYIVFVFVVLYIFISVLFCWLQETKEGEKPD